MTAFCFLLSVLFAVTALSTETVQAAQVQDGLPKAAAKDAIGRHALVTRHNILLTKFDGDRPLQVGNGEFAFGMDITGLQTFAPFNTMSQWGWHTGALPVGQHVEEFQG